MRSALPHIQSLRSAARTVLGRPHIRLVADFFSFWVASAAAYKLVEIGQNLAGIPYVSWDRVVDQRGWAFFLTSMIIVSYLFLKGAYHQKVPFWESSKHLVYACMAALLVEGFLLYAQKSDVSRMLTLATWLIAPVVAMSIRSVERYVSHSVGFGISSVVVVGKEAAALNAARLLRSDPHLGLSVSATFDPVAAINSGNMGWCEGADYVLVALSGSDELENVIIQKLRESGANLIIVPVSNGLVTGMEVRYLLGEDSVLLMDSVEVIPRLNRFAKRLFDILVSSTLLIFAAIPMALVAVVVKADGGPATFSHERIGLNGRTFRCHKFRSMLINADELLQKFLEDSEEHRAEWENGRKLKNDPRITRFGRFIRKTTLDELPQLFNVLKGDMSLVGPRPVTQGELDYYGNTVSFYTSVRPGLTGLWQVSGRSDLNYDQRVRLDTWYVRNWTPWHDIAILLKTIPAVLFRRGAY